MTLLLFYTFKLDAPKDEAQSHDGTWTGTETYDRGIFDMILRAAKFDDLSRITLGGAESDFDFEHTDAFSVSFWMKLDGTTGTAIPVMVAKRINIQATVVGWSIDVFHSTGQMEFRLGSGGTNDTVSSTSSSIPDDKWIHVVCTYDGTSNRNGLKIYLDGVLNATGAARVIGGSLLNNDAVTIGACVAGARPMKGLITEVKIWDVELVAADALQLFHEGTNRYDFNSWDGDDT